MCRGCKPVWTSCLCIQLNNNLNHLEKKINKFKKSKSFFMWIPVKETALFSTCKPKALCKLQFRFLYDFLLCT